MKNNINSNIYVESPVRRKSNLSSKRDAIEIRNHETDSADVHDLQKKYPIPAPRASIERNSSTKSTMIVESIKNASSEYVGDPHILAHDNFEQNYHKDKEVSKCESTEEELQDNPSIEESHDQEFDVSVDVHYKHQDDTTNEDGSETEDEETDLDEQNSSMTNGSIMNSNKKKTPARVISLVNSTDDEDTSVEESNEYLRDCCSPISASEIKLKKPVPGSKIDNLRNQIEIQVGHET